MNRKIKLGVAFAVLGALAAGGYAVAQTMHHMQHMGPGMHGMMHAQKMAQMHGKGGGMHHGGGHGSGHGSDHGGHASSAAKGDQSPSSAAFNAANEKMHRDMAIEFSGDADVDFARAMIPHHQGAVDMAKIVIAFGKDPEIRKLAEEVVRTQEAEIAFMREWLNKRGK